MAVFRPRSTPGSTQKLQANLKDRYQAQEVVLTYKGREAIALILKNLGLPAGSGVAVTGYTCYAVYQAVADVGLTPVYVDIEKDQLNFTALALQLAVDANPSIKAVMIQNTLGFAADIIGIEKICKAKNLILIEDIAHTPGLVYGDGRQAGMVGQAAALSFSQDKLIDAVSGGAAVFKSSLKVKPTQAKAGAWHRFTTRIYPRLMPSVRASGNNTLGKIWLRLIKTLHILPGPMSGKATPDHRLPDWHSAATLEGFGHLADNIAHRRQIAAIYSQSLPKNVQLPADGQTVYLRYPLLVNDPKALTTYLKQFNIYLGNRWYEAPIAPARFMSQTNYQPGSCPNGEWVAAHILNLPTHVQIDEATAKFIAEKVNQWLKSQ